MRRQRDCNPLTAIKEREVFGDRIFAESHIRKSHARKVPLAISEREISLGEVDKVFAAQWLDDSHVLLGTKCNKLILLNLKSSQMWLLPLLEGIQDIEAERKSCGIHTISLNDRLSLLATGAKNPHHLAIYQLPCMEPVAIGQFHKDWIFSSTWISESVVASGSRDGSLAIWKIRDELLENLQAPFRPPCMVPSASCLKSPSVDRVRDMTFNNVYQNLLSISSNGYFHVWDVQQLKQIMVTLLPYCKENVCVAVNDSGAVCAVGSLSHVALLDARNGRHVGTICSKDPGAGIRSVSFKDLLVTVGTGAGSILFYDLRINKFLERMDGSSCVLKVGKGWLRQDSVYREYFWDTESYPNAVYTHCYDPTGLKLFAAGGPLALGLFGNYAGLWD